MTRAEPSLSSSARSPSRLTDSSSTSTTSLPRAFGIHQPVLGLVGIEMGAGRLEVWRIAFANRVHVKGMFAGGNGGEIEPDQHAARSVGQLGLADLVVACVLQHRRGLVRRAGWRHGENKD